MRKGTTWRSSTAARARPGRRQVGLSQPRRCSSARSISRGCRRRPRCSCRASCRADAAQRQDLPGLLAGRRPASRRSGRPRRRSRPAVGPGSEVGCSNTPLARGKSHGPRSGRQAPPWPRCGQQHQAAPGSGKRRVALARASAPRRGCELSTSAARRPGGSAKAIVIGSPLTSSSSRRAAAPGQPIRQPKRAAVGAPPFVAVQFAAVDAAARSSRPRPAVGQPSYQRLARAAWHRRAVSSSAREGEQIGVGRAQSARRSRCPGSRRCCCRPCAWPVRRRRQHGRALRQQQRGSSGAHHAPRTALTAGSSVALHAEVGRVVVAVAVAVVSPLASLCAA